MKNKKAAKITAHGSKVGNPKLKSLGKVARNREELRNLPVEKVSASRVNFPVVGIGGSAGGLEALSSLLKSLRPDTGMAFVLVQHLAPDHKSQLTEILGRATQMPVVQATEGLAVEPNHVYIIPPNRSMGIVNGRLALVPREDSGGRFMPIDFFFRSLADDQKAGAIGLIISGGDSDGVIGLRQIRGEGGVTMVQDPSTASVDSLPRNAIADGCVDFVLPMEKIALELARISEHPFVKPGKMSASKGEFLPHGEHELHRIFSILRGETRVDFSQYKLPTIQRRIKRRMLLHKIENLKDYVRRLQTDTKEVQSLYQDLLINVTNFFRDPGVFAALREKVLPRLFKKRPANLPLRVWIAGCATGEEAYSLAMCLLETMTELGVYYPLQIFGTDLSEQAIARARSGVYSEAIKADVSADRLRRFFVKTTTGYIISRTIRDVCVFAEHDLTRDPPFSRMDLISCRNVLIYLVPALQKRIMTTFHYALANQGYLMVGASESIGANGELFGLLDKKNRIFSKKGSQRLVSPTLIGTQPAIFPKPATTLKSSRAEHSDQDIQREIDRMLLAKFAPVGVVINEMFDCVHFRGDTSQYLQSAPGVASLNIFRMARDGLEIELRTLISKARKSNKSVSKDQRGYRIEVVPFVSGESRQFLVLFEKTESGKNPKSTKKTHERVSAHTARLEQELVASREYLQSVIHEVEGTNEELQSANEEILSSNEELQSFNEELETAKEELQSSNEELTTVNEELYNRNGELMQVNSDLSNLLAGVNIPIIMVGNDLKIRRFTPMAERLFNLISADIGRPITDIKPKLEIPDLNKLILDTIDTFATKECTVRDSEGLRHLLRVRPCRGSDNRIDGVIIILLDVELLRSGA